MADTGISKPDKPKMMPARKIKRRGKFKAPPPECVSCAPNVAGADPSDYLEVLPEARALYHNYALRSKRKSESDTLAPARRMDTTDASWKKHRETRLINLSKMGQSLDGSSSEEDEGDDNDDDDDDEIDRLNIAQSLVRLPRVRKRPPTYHETVDLIDDVMRDFRLTEVTYKNIMQRLQQEMMRGLAKETHHVSTVRMYPTYVRAVPDGSEYGRYLALDLGGTNFRVLLIDLQGKAAPEIKSKLFMMPLRIMVGPGEMLFAHIARCISEFLTEQDLTDEDLPMGFTFSFPCAQDGLASARLVRWTKGFRCSGVEGQDVVRLLEEAINKRGDLRVRCLAIINDPVGALMSAAHSHEDCRIGVILGTGTNCCYMEDLDEVETWDRDREDPKQVIVNTEWGAFGDHGQLDFLRNAFDRELDKNSLNPGHQLFEKMVSGMYMGEIVRLVLCQLNADGLLFGGKGSEELYTPGRFYTKYISEIESDNPESAFRKTEIVLQELDIPNVSLDDKRHVQHVCWQVSQRAAFLAATGVATVINHMQRKTVTVAVDGSLYRFHPHFHDLMKKKIRQLVPPEQDFKLLLAHDGSGKGAALVAAVSQGGNGTCTEHTKKVSMDTSQSQDGASDPMVS